MQGNGLKALNYGAIHVVSFLLDVLVQRGVCSVFGPFPCGSKKAAKEKQEEILSKEQLSG